MKKIFSTLIICGLLASTSCKKYLDVNTNPNSPTSSTPDLVLPQALAATAASMQTFNAYGAWIGGFQANGGGFGGFGSVLTYTYTTSDNTGLWSTSYDNINDYQYILNNTTPTGDYKNFNAVARVMKAFDFIRLVDTYGDVPYTDALKGTVVLQPKYDKAEDVYKACFAEINAAITSMKLAKTLTTVKMNSGANGLIDNTGLSIYSTGGYGGTQYATADLGFNMTNWIKVANTIKLRMLVRIQGVASLSTTVNTEKATLAAEPNGFITNDFIVQPGYQAGVAGKSNPSFGAYAFTSSGTAATTSIVPTFFAIAFYDGHKLVDDGRGKIVYKSYAIGNQLGIQGSAVAVSQSGTNWYTGTGTNANAQALGILKGADAPQPIMLAAESYFLQAEANLTGLLAGTAKTNFDAGILASFTYLDRDHTYTGLGTGRVPATEVTTYQNANSTSYLVNYNVATTDAQRLEAIITQKAIALNFIMCDEAWNEYRRTDYPRNTPGYAPAPPAPVTTSQYTTFASVLSTSPRTDKLPTRILYPASEYSVNAVNAPSGISQFTSRIFWDLN